MLSISGHRQQQLTKKNSGATSCTSISLSVLAFILLLSILTLFALTLLSVHLSRSLHENTLIILDNTPFSTKDTSIAAYSGNGPTATFHSTSDAFFGASISTKGFFTRKNSSSYFHNGVSGNTGSTASQVIKRGNYSALFPTTFDRAPTHNPTKSSHKKSPTTSPQHPPSTAPMYRPTKSPTRYPTESPTFCTDPFSKQIPYLLSVHITDTISDPIPYTPSNDITNTLSDQIPYIVSNHITDTFPIKSPTKSPTTSPSNSRTRSPIPSTFFGQDRNINGVFPFKPLSNSINAQNNFLSYFNTQRSSEQSFESFDVATSPATTFSFSGPPNVGVTMTAAFIFAVWENGSATSGKKSVATVLDNLHISFQEEVVAVGFFARDLGTSTRATSPFGITAVKDGMTTEYSFPINLSEPRSNNAEGAMYFGIVDMKGIDSIAFPQDPDDSFNLDHISAFTLSEVK
jgi:hypothetical protein